MEGAVSVGPRCRFARAAVVALVLGISAAAAGLVPAGEAASGYRSYAEAMVARLPAGVQARPDLEAVLAKELNRYRVAQGRKPLEISPAAVTAARAQALDMLKGNFVGHQSASGYRFAQRVEAFVGETWNAAENAARDRQPGQADARKAQRLFQQWVDSRGHRRNMTSADHEEVSTGVIQSGNHIYAVQIFWKRRATQNGLSAFRSW